METGSSFSLLELFQMGGLTMWPLTFFSIITVVISIERLIYFVYHNLQMDDLKAQVQQFIESGDMEGAKTYLSELTQRRIGARILLTLINRAQLSEHQIEKAVEAESLDCIKVLENGLSFLTTIGSIAPLTGFLGTVAGMIGAFKSIAEATEVNAQIVAGGIYEALITTVYGLIIAIIAAIFHSLFSNMVDTFITNVEKTCSDLITELMLTHQDAPAPNLSSSEEPLFKDSFKIRLPAPKPTQADIIALEDYT
jgi:biopolymer transport protein ExbB